LNTVVSFSRLHEWALIPHKLHVERGVVREKARIYEKNFRYLRIVRAPELCPPWVLGQELGWVVPSPVDVELTAVDDVQFDVDSPDELGPVGRMVGRSDVWHRTSGWLATERNDWLRFNQFRGADGWEGMFVPNGSGTIEWRLGWTAAIPDGTFLLVMALDGNRGFDVPTAVLTAGQVAASSNTAGMSLAIRPHASARIARGDLLARLVLLNRDSLRASAEESL
jgi:hypothetical protein